MGVVGSGTASGDGGPGSCACGTGGRHGAGGDGGCGVVAGLDVVVVAGSPELRFVWAFFCALSGAGRRLF